MVGTIRIVGIGPGAPEHRTRAAEEAIRGSDLVVGYGPYLEMIRDLVANRDVFASSMMEEIERADVAIASAKAGRNVAVVASGDACVYGIGGLILERLSDDDLRQLDVSVIPGVTAANAAASLLGAPLMNDYMVLSLSDLLTERELILKRLRCAAESDIALALYNPRSRTRTDLILKARAILLEHRPPETPAAIVHGAYRDDERVSLCPLGDLDRFVDEIDMVSLVVVGDSRSRFRGKLIVTPRGYGKKRISE